MPLPQPPADLPGAGDAEAAIDRGVESARSLARRLGSYIERGLGAVEGAVRRLARLFGYEESPWDDYERWYMTRAVMIGMGPPVFGGPWSPGPISGSSGYHGARARFAEEGWRLGDGETFGFFDWLMRERMARRLAGEQVTTPTLQQIVDGAIPWHADAAPAPPPPPPLPIAFFRAPPAPSPPVYTPPPTAPPPTAGDLTDIERALLGLPPLGAQAPTDPLYGGILAALGLA